MTHVPSNEFEVNTDAALVDPDWEGFVQHHDARYGLAIHHLKSLVKGRRFDNEAMKLRVGPEGFYLQSRRFPAAFHGGTGRSDVRFIDFDEAQAIAWEAIALYRSGDARSLTVVYDDDDPPEAFFGYRVGSEERFEMGELSHGQPIHLRVTVDAVGPQELIDGGRGTVVYQRAADGRHVLLKRPGAPLPYQPLQRLRD